MNVSGAISFDEREFEAERARRGLSYVQLCEKTGISKRVLESRRKHPEDWTIKEIHALIGLFGNDAGFKIFRICVPKRNVVQ